MKVLRNEQLEFLKYEIDRMRNLLEQYEGFTNSKIQSRLKIMSNNIEQCIEYNFDGIEELSKYVYEDWRNVCIGKEGIEYNYFEVADIDMKAKINREFEECAISIEKMLETNFIILRKWYYRAELIRMGIQYKEREEDWNMVIKQLMNTNRYYQSPINWIPNDIWSFAKMLSISETDDTLLEWFKKNIPAFGHLSPKIILEIEGGDNILRNFMFDIPM